MKQHRMCVTRKGRGFKKKVWSWNRTLWGCAFGWFSPSRPPGRFHTVADEFSSSFTAREQTELFIETKWSGIIKCVKWGQSLSRKLCLMGLSLERKQSLVGRKWCHFVHSCSRLSLEDSRRSISCGTSSFWLEVMKPLFSAERNLDMPGMPSFTCLIRETNILKLTGGNEEL